MLNEIDYNISDLLMFGGTFEPYVLINGWNSIHPRGCRGLNQGDSNERSTSNHSDKTKIRSSTCPGGA